MKYKTLYGIHEARMWTNTIVSVAGVIGAIALTHPEIVDAAKEKVKSVKERFKKKPKLKIVVVDSEEKP